MIPTIRIDSNTHTYADGSLYVIEQVEFDPLDVVSWRAVDSADATFAAPMRAHYILIHDREVGVLISRRVAHAFYRHSARDEGRRYDQFGNTWLHAPTKALVERSGPAAQLVNIEYVAGPTRRSYPALPPVTANALALGYDDMQFVGEV